MHWFSEGREYYARKWFTGMLKAHPGRWRLFDSQISSAAIFSAQDVVDRVAVIICCGGSDGPLAHRSQLLMPMQFTRQLKRLTQGREYFSFIIISWEIISITTWPKNY